MTVAVVLAEPPMAGAALPGLAGSVLDGEARARLYRAMLVDVCRAIQDGGSDLLVNYRPADQVAATLEDADEAGVETPLDEAGDDAGNDAGDLDPEAALRDALRDLLPRPDDARYEVQVGETLAGRLGNTVTHLIEEEGADSAVVVDPAAPFVARPDVGQAAMKLRTSEVVLAPAPGGRVAVAGFSSPIDFEDALATPAVETLTDRAVDAGHDVDFLPVQPVVEGAGDLVDLVSGVRARRRAERRLPAATAAVVEDLGLRVGEDGGVVSSDNS